MLHAGLDPAERGSAKFNFAATELRHIAEEAARAGGHVARRFFRTKLAVRLKDDRSEVSDADEAAQAAVTECIQAHRPDHAFIAEETLLPRADGAREPAPSNDAVCWVVDPIDGTRNFVRGIPLYVCSVAAMLGGTPLVGAIYEPERDVLYSASLAEGFFVDSAPQSGRPVGAARPAGLNPRYVVGIPSTPVGPASVIAQAWLGRFVCRNLGSTALHLAMVATGELDAMLTDNSRLWDIAAGWVLVTASGGRMTGLGDAPLFPLDVGKYRATELPALAADAQVYAALLPQNR
jgi:myo-inositol-1(or 4)-monophosphatase